MTITVDQIKELREKTGVGISDVKKALEDSGGDIVKAYAWLERKLGSSALKKAGREIKAGLVEAYVHSNGRIGSLVEVGCETDFVARNPQFKEFAHDLVMHIAAMTPLYLSIESVPRDAWQAEKSRFEEEVKKMGKPAAIIKQIVDGKLKTYFGALSFLEQPFVKDQNKKVGDVINEAIGKFGENIKVGRFIRYEI